MSFPARGDRGTGWGLSGGLKTTEEKEWPCIPFVGGVREMEAECGAGLGLGRGREAGFAVAMLGCKLGMPNIGGSIMEAQYWRIVCPTAGAFLPPARAVKPGQEQQ